MGEKRVAEIARELFERWLDARMMGETEFVPTELAGDSPQVLAELERLIERYRSIDLALPSPSRPSAPAAERQPPRLADYRIGELLGEGGMGEVWQAEQQRPIRRPVALKVIKRGLDTHQVVQRFNSERQAIAAMDHPSIAKVFDAGMTEDGRPFFAMERVTGSSITRYCDERRLSTRSRLELFSSVCDGVRHAHQKGVIHRDLKPSNVLVSEHDGKAQPKIIDFGIAKAMLPEPGATAATLTQLGQVVGTPAYMSPEQADMLNLDVDTRSDVYSLGVLLYELLVGVRPFGDGRLAVDGTPVPKERRDIETPSSRISSLGVRAEDVAKLRSVRVAGLVRTLRGDLDWIVLKALEEDREKRYSSTTALVEDLRRYFRDEPVLAGPPNLVYRTNKFIRRHRVAVGLGVLIFLALGSAFAGLAVGLDRALKAEERARSESQVAQSISDFLAGLFEGADPKSKEGETSARELLDRGSERISAELADQPLVQARLLEIMGRAYLGLGDYEPSISLFEEAAELRLREQGDGSLELAQTFADLSDATALMGDIEGAREKALMAWEIRQEKTPELSLPNAESTGQIAMLFWRQGRYEEALEHMREALRLREKLAGSDIGPLAKMLSNVGILEMEMDDLEGAEKSMRRGLTLFEQEFGRNHPNVAASLNNLALVAGQRNDNEGAAQLLRESLEIREVLLGADHPDIAESLNNLGIQLHVLGRYDEARQALERSVKIRRQVLGESHPQLASSLGNLGRTIAEMGELVEGSEMIQKADDMFVEHLGAGHPYTSFSQEWLATYIARQGRPEEAMSHVESCLEIREKDLGRVHPMVANCLAVKRDILIQLGRDEEAEKIAARVEEIRGAGA